MTPESKQALIIGHGYVGHHLARHLDNSGWTVAALSRSKPVGPVPIQHLPGNLDRPEQLPDLHATGKTLFYLAPPPTNGQTDPRVAALLQHIAHQHPDRMIYISTTGVYGDCGGAWVDEQRATAPTTDRARRRLDAEMALAHFCQTASVPLAILRVAGIYGPGRLPIARLKAGKPMLSETEAPFSNRIHVDDLIQVLAATATQAGAQGIYNVSDGHPSTMTDYFNRVATAVGLPPPVIIKRTEMGDQISPEMQSYLNESRRLDNRRIREELGVTLHYPDLESGLRASITGEMAE